MDQILARMTPTKQSFPLSSFLTPPDENQPLDFSKRARGRGRVSPLTPGTPGTPVLSVPTIQPRKLQPDLCLPHSPLPLTVLGQSLRTNLTQQSPAPPPQMSPMSPFLFGAAGLCFPSLLQSMISQTPPAPAAPVSPPASDKTELLRVNSESLGQYAVFRQNMLRQLAEKKPVSSRRDSSDSSEQGQAQLSQQEDVKDQAYWERRRKNNLAAKRSRDARRAKEDEIAIRAAFLEQENIQLKWEVARLKTETGRLRALLLADSDNEEIEIETTSA